MKYKTLLLFFMLCCMACVQATRKPLNAFWGRWINCETISRDEVITANMCPHFTFSDNNTGVFAMGTRVMIFTYNANITAHTIKFTGIYNANWFGKDTVLHYAFNNSVGDTTLILTTADSVQYILRK